MNKTVKFVYERIRDTGEELIPKSNNYNLNFSDLTNVEPHFYKRLPSSELCPADTLPDDVFLYELNWDYRKSHQGFFDEVLASGNIRDSILIRVKEKTAFILFTVLFEGWMTDQFISIIEENFKKANIPLSQIIYASNCFNGDRLYKDYCERNNINLEMRFEYFPTFRIHQTDVEQALENREYTPGVRKKTFLCFNRRFSDHRLMFYMLVERRGLLDQFYLSMSKDQPESTNKFLDNASYLIHKYPEFGITQYDISRADSRLPLILDSPDFNRYPMENNPLSMKEYYDTSLVNIVNETYFFNNIIHITEKTYKPIAFMQPFIIVAAPFSLKHIADMGFKTFGDFWDESYDTETDHIVRMHKIINLVESIIKWTDAEKLEFTYRSAEILKYNRSHLKTMKHIETYQFVEKYGHEM
jgi:hypothetical protein